MTKRINKAFKLEGWQLLSPYVNARSNLDFVCSEGHRHQITWDNFLHGKRCGVCDHKHLGHEEVSRLFMNEGYQLLSRYTPGKSQEPLKILCPKGHKHQISLNNFNTGYRCGRCHVATQYAHKDNRLKGKILSRLWQHLKKTKEENCTEKIYSKSLINCIAENILSIYDSCPQGCSVDHIVPVSWFNLLNENELLACWNPNNLRHLDAIANIRRQNKMTQEEIDFMLEKHPEIIKVSTKWKLTSR